MFSLLIFMLSSMQILIFFEMLPADCLVSLRKNLHHQKMLSGGIWLNCVLSVWWGWMTNLYLIVGWEWSLFQDQKKHSAEKAYECILWSTICRVYLNCFLVWWPSSPSRTDSWGGLSLSLLYLQLAVYGYVVQKNYWPFCLFLVFS